MPLKIPTPLHGWRDFAGEVGVIVLGVLIALGAQQAVDNVQWREEVRRTEAALTDEIAKSVVDAAERHMVDRCLRSRTSDLIGKVSTSGGEWVGNPMPVARSDLVTTVPVAAPAAYRTPTRDWSDHVWQAAKSSGVLTHMPRERVSAYANIYAVIGILRDANRLEANIFPTLLYLSFDTTLDAEDRQRALSALGHLDWMRGAQLNETRRLINAVRDMKLDFSKTDLASNLAEKQRSQRVFRGDCVQHVKLRL
jgi:hypothetical protein